MITSKIALLLRATAINIIENHQQILEKRKGNIILEMSLFDGIIKKGLSVTATDKVKVIHHLLLGNLLYCLGAVNEDIRSFNYFNVKSVPL